MFLKEFLLFLLCFPSFFECISPKMNLEWWQSEVIYQIYPRSFKDSDGDGIGDLNGIRQKLTHVKDMGMGAIWLSPIFKSPMVDFGYDISSFRDIDSIFGTMEDMENLLREARKLGIKVILDYVPNHTSDKHEWFQKSVKRIPPYTDYYVWKNPIYKNGKRYPPNNWLSNFGKSAWEWNEERGQYYLHQFAIQQPDLNYRNPVVYEEMKNILIYWMDKGIDGFRMDAVIFIYEDLNFQNESRSYKRNVLPDDYEYLDHKYSKDQPETIELIKDWRSVIDQYSRRGRTRFMMTEGYTNIDTVMEYYGTKENPGSNFPFNFLFIDSITRSASAHLIVEKIQEWFKKMPPHGWANWVIGNHDNSRPASRFDRHLIDGLHMLQLLLPGTPIVYNGDEMGMEDTFIRWDQTVDPPALNAGPERYYMFSRDKTRTPFQWDDSENAGFTNSLHTWLPVNPNYWKINVAEQLNDTNRITHMQIFKILTRLRKNIVFQRGDLRLNVINKWVLVMTRTFVDHSTFIVAVNFGSDIEICDFQSIRPSLPDKLGVVVASVNSDHYIGQIVDSNAVKIRPKGALVMATSEEDVEFNNDNYRIAKHGLFNNSQLQIEN